MSEQQWWRVDKAILVDGLRQREHAICRMLAEQGAILAEIHSRGVLAEFGYGTLDALQSDALNISKREAKKRTARALACHDTRGMGSTVIPAAAPAAAQAAGEGAIGGEHVDVLLGVLTGMPTDVPPDEREAYEKTMVDLARVTNPETVRKVGHELLARLDQDGAPPNEAELAHPERDLHVTWRRDGRLAFKGHLDAETGKALETVLSPLSKPRPEDNGLRDSRTVGERQGDALAEIIDLVQRDGELPTEAGEKPTLTITLDINQLLEGIATMTNPALLNGDTPITPEQARRIACDADIIPAVLGGNSEVLDLGRGQRLVNRAQRRALNLRDKGCIFPGCTRPTRWCQAHHLKHWIDGGPTDIANLCLICTEHHRLIHHSEWEIVMAPDGHPECIPPPYIDPTGTPRRNHAHEQFGTLS